MKAWLDGEIVDAKDAKVSPLDHGYLYGDGVFEGIRIAHGRVFRLDDHLARLANSAKLIGLALPMSIEAIKAVVVETARAFGREAAYVRLVVSRGEGPLSVDPTICHEPKLVCLVGTVSLYSEELQHRGLSLITAATRRPPPDVLDPRVQSLNYLNNAMAKRQARLGGADDALLLNQAGRVAEASVANVFCVRDGSLFTPSLCEGPLGGITRDSVLKLARGLGIEIHECPLTRYDLITAEEAFLTGSGAGLIPVAELDGVSIGQGDRRVVTDRLIGDLDAFRKENGEVF